MGVAVRAVAGLLLLLAMGAVFAAAGRDAPVANACGSAGPFRFDAYESTDNIRVYSQAIELATAGLAIPGQWTVAGETVNVAYQGLLSGPRSNRTTTLNTALKIPPTVFKAIVTVEVGTLWDHALSEVPWGGVGRVKLSTDIYPSRTDCGYGLGQITSGMFNNTGTAAARQALIASHFLFNIAEGVRILADKWNSAPRFRPIAGNGDPEMLEDWYYAIWSYNGFWFGNHPLDPRKPPLRGEVFHCGDRDAPGFGSFAYADYTYPERVYGCMRYPPKDAGKPRWPAQVFHMPDLRRPQVAAAFDPENFVSSNIDADKGCEDVGFRGGCPEMDYPTTLPEQVIKDPACKDDSDACPTITLPELRPNRDTTPPIDPTLAAKFLGSPRLTYNGPSTVSITVEGDQISGATTFSLGNAGTYLAPYRIRTSAPWILVHRPDQPGQRFHGGVTVGSETEVVLSSNPLRTQKGYNRSLVISVDLARLPSGESTGTLFIDPVMGPGGPFTVTVHALRSSAPPGPGPTPPGRGLPYRALVPGVTRGQ
jgi:hypothetical protein